MSQAVQKCEHGVTEDYRCFKCDPIIPAKDMSGTVGIVAESGAKPKRIRKPAPRSPEVVIACMEEVLAGIVPNPATERMNALLDELKRALRK